MALLQSNKAVFYHPLDDATETLQSQAWTGTGTFSAAKISSGLTAPPGTTPSFGAEAEFDTADVDVLSVAALSATQFVVVHSENLGASQTGKSRVGTVSGTDITYGSSVTFGPTFVDRLEIAALDSTKVVAAYRDGSGPVVSSAQVGTVSGTDITWGAEHQFESASVNHIDIAALSATKVVLVYQDGVAPGNDAMAQIGTVSGTDITFGANKAMTSGLSGPIFKARVAALSSTQFIGIWRNDAAGGFDGRGIVGTVSGTDITFGANAAFLPGSSAELMDVTALSSTVAVVAYKDQAGGDRGKAKVGTVSGADLTWGPETEFHDGTAGGPSEPVVGKIDSAKCVLCYSDAANSSRGTARIGTVSGTDITFGTGATYSTGNSNRNSVSGLSSGAFVSAFKDVPDSGNGTAAIGSMAGAAARTAPTPAAYGTAAAATKVAFAGWLKNPSA